MEHFLALAIAPSGHNCLLYISTHCRHLRLRHRYKYDLLLCDTRDSRQTPRSTSTPPSPNEAFLVFRRLISHNLLAHHPFSLPKQSYRTHYIKTSDIPDAKEFCHNQRQITTYSKDPTDAIPSRIWREKSNLHFIYQKSTSTSYTSSTSHAPRSNSLTSSLSAHSRAVLSVKSLTSLSAPFSNNILMTPVIPHPAARCSAVRPMSSRAWTSAPQERRSRIRFSSPIAAATDNGYRPWTLAELTSFPEVFSNTCFASGKFRSRIALCRVCGVGDDESDERVSAVDVRLSGKGDEVTGSVEERGSESE